MLFSFFHFVDLVFFVKSNAQTSQPLQSVLVIRFFLFRPLKMGRNLYSGVLLFLLVFHAKAATTNNVRTGLGDKSY